MKKNTAEERKRYTVHSIPDAWSLAHEIFPTDYERDSRATERAGYPIYWSTAEGVTAWISDLGSRLEVNLPNGQSVNIWIECKAAEGFAEKADPEAEAEKAVEADHAAKRLSLAPLYTPRVAHKVTLWVGTLGGDDERLVYEGLRRDQPCLAFELLASYAKKNGIKWGTMSDICVSFHDYKNGGGHAIVEGYIFPMIGAEAEFMAKSAELLMRQHEEHQN